MPLMKGDLWSLRNQGVFNDQNAFFDVVLRQMLSALDRLALDEHCHRDVKPANILWTWENGRLPSSMPAPSSRKSTPKVIGAAADDEV